MAIPYKKQFVKSDGRKLNRSGPRDMQHRAASTPGADPTTELVTLLTGQIAELKTEIQAMKSRGGDIAPPGFFSPEQVDDEIRKAVEQAVAEAALSFKGQPRDTGTPAVINEYKSQILELQKGNDNLTKLHTAIVKENTELKSEITKLNEQLVDVKQQIAVLEQEISGKEEVIATLKSRPIVVQEGAVETDPDRPQMEQVFIDPLEEGAGEGMKSSINVETITKDETLNDQVDKLKSLLGKKLPNI